MNLISRKEASLPAYLQLVRSTCKLNFLQRSVDERRQCTASAQCNCRCKQRQNERAGRELMMVATSFIDFEYYLKEYEQRIAAELKRAKQKEYRVTVSI